MLKKVAWLCPLVRLIFFFVWTFVTAQMRYRDMSQLLAPEPSAYLPVRAKSSSRIVCAGMCSIHGCSSFTFQDSTCEIEVQDVQPRSNPISSRYILQITDTSNLENVALGQPTLPSIHFSDLSSDRAVDSDESTQFYSHDENNPWWSVDLSAPYIIRAIDVLPSTDVPEWFIDIKIFVGSTEVTDGDFSSYTIVGIYPGPWDGNARLLFSPVMGTTARYVAIQGYSGNYSLVLLDVKVMA